jgi:hypothetical protein
MTEAAKSNTASAEASLGSRDDACNRDARQALGADGLENARGPDHPDVATSLNGLALLYASQGR